EPRRRASRTVAAGGYASRSLAGLLPPMPLAETETSSAQLAAGRLGTHVASSPTCGGSCLATVGATNADEVARLAGRGPFRFPVERVLPYGHPSRPDRIGR